MLCGIAKKNKKKNSSRRDFHPMPLGLPSAPGPSTCLMHPTWAGDLFHPEGSGGEGGGRGDRDGEYMYIHG